MAAVSSGRTSGVLVAGPIVLSGGLKEKTLAAHRGGIKTFILPRRNAKDLAELPTVVQEGMELIQVDTLDEVLAVALLPADAGSRSLQVA